MRRHRRPAVAVAAKVGVVVVADAAAAAVAAAAAAETSAGSPCGDAPVSSRHRVAVLGAGVAGATVARGLAAAGVKGVVVVEGGGAVGGRLRQQQLGDLNVEVGANWYVW